MVAQSLDRPTDLLQETGCCRHMLSAAVHGIHAFVDQTANLGGTIGAALGKPAHLLRHHGKTPAVFAGPGCLHRRIERQQVDLEGNGVDHVDHLAHALAGIADRCHGPGGRGGALLGFRSTLGCLHGQLLGPHGGLGGLGNGLGQLFCGGMNLLEPCGLFFGTLAEILIAQGNLPSCLLDAFGMATDQHDDLRQLEAHHLHSSGDQGIITLIEVLVAEACRKIAMGNARQDPGKELGNAILLVEQLLQGQFLGLRFPQVQHEAQEGQATGAPRVVQLSVIQAHRNLGTIPGNKRGCALDCGSSGASCQIVPIELLAGHFGPRLATHIIDGIPQHGQQGSIGIQA